MGSLSDDNGKMDPYRLNVWVSIGANRNVFMPKTKAILERYMAKVQQGRYSGLERCRSRPGIGTCSRVVSFRVWCVVCV